MVKTLAAVTATHRSVVCRLWLGCKTVNRPCLEIIQNSEVIDQIQIINGLTEGNITKALRGEHVGTIIRKP